VTGVVDSASGVPGWKPDLETIDWCFGVADGPLIGRLVAQQLSMTGVSEEQLAKIGEAAVESVLYTLRRRAIVELEGQVGGQGQAGPL
jgi:hypothetical protein